MGAPAISRDVETMPPSTDVASIQASAQVHAPIKISHGKKLVFMLPVLAATAMAAVIAVFPLEKSTLYALFFGEVAFAVFSIFVLVPRPQKR